MKKILLAALALAALVSCSCPVQDVFPQVYAHRGCHLDGLIPENSVAGIEMAARFGYPAVEIDVKNTLDSVLVVMHDGSINRTMRTADGYEPVPAPVRVTGTPFEELRTQYVLASDDPAQRAPIPTLAEMLDACRRCGIHPVLHSQIEASYDLAQEMMGDDWTCFTHLYDKVAYARSISNCKILWDPDRTPAAETVERLQPLGGWLGMSTMKYDMLDADYIATMHAAGMHTQSSIFPVPHEADALRDGADIILSDFCWLQTEGRTPLDEHKTRLLVLSGDAVETYTCPEELEFGAMVLEFTFCGQGSVTVNGKEVYPLDSGTEQRFFVGYRSRGIAPSFEIRTGEGGLTVKGLRVRCYRI